jgi:type VI secretion system FHA domain protein
MHLILTVIRYQNLPPRQALSARISVAGGTIGRGSDRDLVLEDSDRWVGREHAEISFRDGSFFLRDTSKNGTFVNKGSEPLHMGQEVELQDGDQLGIGAYEVRVTLEAEPAQPEGAFDPFSGGEVEPLAQPPLGRDSPDIMDLVGGAGAGSEPPFPSPEQQEAPVRLEDWLTPDPRDEAPWTLGEDREPPPAPAPAAEPDHIPNENAFFSPPDAIPESYDIWADESRFQPEPPTDQTPEPEPPVAPPPAPPAPSVPPPESRKPSPAAFTEATRQTTPVSDAAGEAKALAAFLDGLGAGELPTDPDDRARLMRTSGQLLRAMTEGLMRVMMGRASFKSELRLEMTAIRSTNNNPFKFSVDPEDALAHLLFRPSRGFLQPLEAAREAFDDIQCHEMAMMAGLRAAMRALLAHMDPAELEKRFQDRSLIDSLMPMARKARCWDLFATTYDQISADAADDFLHLFKDAFTAAYEDQASRLGRARARDKPVPDSG